MPRIQYVKKARQRFAMVPDLDESGQQKITNVMKNGKPLVDKSGRPVQRRITRPDPTIPLPNYKCEACQKEIEPGMPYKFVEPKLGPMRVRCMECPVWQPWDLSSSLAARLEQIQHEYATTVDPEEDEDDVQSKLEDAAYAVREIAEEKRESANNIEEGFQHPTAQSDELNEIADNLDSWADEIEGWEIPEKPEEDKGEAWDNWAEEATEAISEALANCPI